MLDLENVTDAYRVVHAEGDDLSGLIVDKLGDALVCQYHSLRFWELRETVARSCGSYSPPRGAAPLARTARGPEGFPDDPARTGTPWRPATSTSMGCASWCTRARATRPAGSATSGTTGGGWPTWRRGEVLDLCCHAGSFSIPAALSSATSVTAVDLDEEPWADESARPTRPRWRSSTRTPSTSSGRQAPGAVLGP